ncbi:MAG: BMC domain-containing protein [Candidatus Atribacteria bacterium]|nr:BMC domain-containing protein [Candidatus Atribacteria bacterium]
MGIIVLGVLELNSIAVGLQALDGMVKAAPIQIVDAKTICPGKFIVIVSGEVAAVDAALTQGKEIGGGYVVDELFIPNLHSQVIPAITGTVECEIWDAVAIIESFSVVASISAADIAAKTANILVSEVRLATGMGGKSYIKIIGDIYEVEAAVRAAVEIISGKGLLCKEVIIPHPHPDIRNYFIF